MVGSIAVIVIVACDPRKYRQLGQPDPAKATRSGPSTTTVAALNVAIGTVDIQHTGPPTKVKPVRRTC